MTDRQKDLSIVAIIALYNGAKFIEESVRSVLAQTLKPTEFIVVDDGSTDDGPAIVERLAKEHPVTLLRKPNGGQSSARNFGVTHSKSRLIALLDQDDAWYPHHLEKLVEPFKMDRGIPLGWVYSNLDEIDEGGGMVTKRFIDTLPGRHPKQTLTECIGQDMYILPSASLIAREAFEAAGGFDERLSGYEDDDLFLRLFRAGYDHTYIDEPLSKWRIYPGSTSYSPRMARSRMIYAKKLFEWFPDNPKQDRYYARDLIAPRFLANLLGECLKAMWNEDHTALPRILDDMQLVLRHLPKRKHRLLRLATSVLKIPGAARAVTRAKPILRPVVARLL